jgi:RNA polymerase sigma factor (sigma-70 family)
MEAVDVAVTAGHVSRQWFPVQDPQGFADEAVEQLQSPAPAPLSVSRLAQQHHGEFMRFLRRRVPAGPVSAEDIAQEAYIRVLQYEGSRNIREPYFLLLRVAMNVLRDLHRAERVRRSHRHHSLGGVELASDVADPERAALHAEELELVLAAIADLTPRCREVFLLHRFSHSAYPQIARDFGISVKMVEKYISTALARCTERVAGNSCDVVGERV